VAVSELECECWWGGLALLALLVTNNDDAKLVVDASFGGGGGSGGTAALAKFLTPVAQYAHTCEQNSLAAAVCRYA